MQSPLTPGTLYLVATPLGNLEDITLRALRVLKECDVVAAEDTRHTGQLLRHFDISKPLLSYFQFNEAKRSEEIIERLRRGEKVALVTDAGSPGISDPGERVVKAAIEAGMRRRIRSWPMRADCRAYVERIANGRISFHWFSPAQIRPAPQHWSLSDPFRGTLVLYESPFRIEKLLGELADIFPERDVVLARELTKKFEEFLRGKPSELLQQAQSRKLKGEFVVMISAADLPGNQVR